MSLLVYDALMDKETASMKTLEQSSLQHAKDELRYQRSPQAWIDAQVDKARRAAADKKAGHVPGCSLTKCAPGCNRT
jgi:hypothetical protein